MRRWRYYTAIPARQWVRLYVERVIGFHHWMTARVRLFFHANTYPVSGSDCPAKPSPESGLSCGVCDGLAPPRRSLGRHAVFHWTLRPAPARPRAHTLGFLRQTRHLAARERLVARCARRSHRRESIDRKLMGARQTVSESGELDRPWHSDGRTALHVFLPGWFLLRVAFAPSSFPRAAAPDAHSFVRDDVTVCPDDPVAGSRPFPHPAHVSLRNAFSG